MQSPGAYDVDYGWVKVKTKGIWKRTECSGQGLRQPHLFYDPSFHPQNISVIKSFWTKPGSKRKQVYKQYMQQNKYVQYIQYVHVQIPMKRFFITLYMLFRVSFLFLCPLQLLPLS
jgi:hypothetical protein